MKNVLLLKAGEAANAIRLVAGDYDHWFAEAFRKAEAPLNVRRVDAFLGERLPRATDFDAIVITGSPQSMTAPPDWTRAAGDYALEAAEQKVPVLGVCFGHQLIGHALGKRVIRNPNGREIGTVAVHLTPEGRADPLFEGIAPEFAIQTTHEDIVSELPEGATLLASNGSTRVQAMAIGKHLRGVQFHPELSVEGMRAVIESRVEVLERESQARGASAGDRLRTLRGALAPTRAGVTMLRNFIRAFT